MKKPIHIVQIFDNSYQYGKDEKSYETRKEKYAWKEKLDSRSGSFAEGNLKLNKDKVDAAKLAQCSLLLLVDQNPNPYLQAGREAAAEVATGEITRTPFSWNCFRFKKAEFIELELVWDYWEIGRPERGNFKLCDLKKGEPVEININGKRDFSLFGRRKRSFIERNFILEYLGETKEYELDELRVEKKIPQERKRVNLLKELY